MKSVTHLALINSLLFSSALFSSPLAAQADNSAEMMKLMAEAQNCMMQLDFQELTAMEAKSKQLEGEILDLCASGKESQAKAVALKFSDEVMNSKTMLGMKKCFEGIPSMAQQIEVPDFRQELEQKSICDVVKNK